MTFDVLAAPASFFSVAAITEMATLERAGHVHPTEDEVVRALLMLCIGLGPVVLRPVVESALGASLRSEEGLRRWFEGEVELLGRGIYKVT